MDADSEKLQRDLISRRKSRWSMNSQRLEQIVAELMRPIGDLRRSFDTDISALLEEYLTEAGLHALENEGAGTVVPNFAELALLLQQSAHIYGRKVDLLYQHVKECSESLYSNTETPATPEGPEGPEASPATPHGSRRKRRHSVTGWARIELEPCAAARREPELRPPPTLPRMYVELEPRVLAPCDAPLLDYVSEPVGLLQDFHVMWRMHGGLLVDELECGEADTSLALRAIPLSELQAAIEAAAPPSPPPPPAASPEPPDDHPHSSTPVPTEEPPPPPEASPIAPEPPAEALARTRKRKLRDPDLFQTGAGKIRLTAELRIFLREEREFCINEEWVSRVVEVRCAKVLAGRARLRIQSEIKEFRGFDEVDKSDLVDIGGFLGWTATEAERSPMDVSCLSRLLSAESDDDGFFEQSSLGSEGSRPVATPPPATPPPPPTPPPPAPLPPPVDYSAQPEWMSWRADVVARASAGEAKGLDVRALGAAVLGALPRAGGDEGARGPATPFNTVLGSAAKDDSDVSRLFLATLFLANAGNVEVVQGPPLSLNSFSLQLVSRDERLYCAAADADPAFLR